MTGDNAASAMSMPVMNIVQVQREGRDLTEAVNSQRLAL